MTKRYQYFPQMQYYDKMYSGLNVPFAMLSGPVNYKSQYINTDTHGFRFTKINEQYVSIEDIDNFEEVNILIGGSTVFGVGSTNDDSTITSYLSEATGEIWFNMGIRGGVSLTEYIHLIRFIHRAKKIKNLIFFSGINDIYINQLKNTHNNYDNLFNSINFNNSSCQKKIIVSILSQIYRVDSEILMDKNWKEILFYPKYKKKIEKIKILNDNEKFELTMSHFDRNFMLYSALKKELNCCLVYILQPFTDWTEKVFTKEEIEVFQELEELQSNTKWASHRQKLSKELYSKIILRLEEIAVKRDIAFIDAHKYFTNFESLFVDAVHLTDNGNKLVANLIQKSIKNYNL